MKPKILLLIGASSSGKNTIGKYIEELGIPKLITHTTRPMRQGEIEGETYYYVSKEEFANIDKLERTYYAGNHYCLSRQEVERHNENLVYCIVDEEGVRQIRLNYDDVTVVYLDVSYFKMIIRMLKRGDNPKDIYKRLKHAITKQERKKGKEIANYCIPSMTLNKVKNNVKRIVNKLKMEM